MIIVCTIYLFIYLLSDVTINYNYLTLLNIILLIVIFKYLIQRESEKG